MPAGERAPHSPKMADAPSEVSIMLCSMEELKVKVTEQLQTLEDTQEYMNISAEAVIERVNARMDALLSSCSVVIERHRRSLVAQVTAASDSVRKPLADSLEEGRKNLRKVTSLIKEGKKAAAGNTESVPTSMYEGRKEVLSSLMASCEVERMEVPAVKFALSHTERVLEQAIVSDAQMAAVVPVKITDLLPRPGAILVRWAELSDDIDATGAIFRMESREVVTPGDGEQQAAYKKQYEGPHRSAIVRDLTPHVPYEFKVTCSCDPGHELWSPWSRAVTAVTSQDGHAWTPPAEDEGFQRTSAPLYEVTSGGRLLTTLDERQVTVPSASNSYVSGHEVSFRILSVGTGQGHKLPDGLGLSLSADSGDVSDNCLFVNSSGSVHINGSPMVNKLPPLAPGLTLTVATEPLARGKIRATLEIKDKQIICDWRIRDDLSGQGHSPSSPAGQGHCPSSPLDHRQRSVSLTGGDSFCEEESQQFYLVGRFSRKGWRVYIE